MALIWALSSSLILFSSSFITLFTLTLLCLILPFLFPAALSPPSYITAALEDAEVALAFSCSCRLSESPPVRLYLSHSPYLILSAARPSPLLLKSWGLFVWRSGRRSASPGIGLSCPISLKIRELVAGGIYRQRLASIKNKSLEKYSQIQKYKKLRQVTMRSFMLEF